jgi:hypothetical protein
MVAALRRLLVAKETQVLAQLLEHLSLSQSLILWKYSTTPSGRWRRIEMGYRSRVLNQAHSSEIAQPHRPAAASSAIDCTDLPCSPHMIR